MGFELPPSEVKALLPQATGSQCEQLKKLIEFPRVLHELVEFMFTESGALTEEFQALLCDLDCSIGSGGGGGTNPPNPEMPAPANVNATDGTYSDKIVVTWNAVTPPSGVAAVTQYRVYRALSTVTDPNSATLIATVTAPTLTYDDTSATQGTIFKFWVKATNGTDTSAFGGPDNGSASAPTTTLDPISDLRCTKGFGTFGSEPIALVWTPPAGAEKYDIYRHTANDFSAATKVYSDIVPEPTIDNYIPDTSPHSCWDCDEEIVFYDFPASATVKYWYWVVAKKDSPPAVSDESNADEGWVRTGYAPYTTTNLTMLRGDSLQEGVDFTGLNIRVVLIGGAGGGAGGSEVYGGGGGGGGGVVIEEFVLSAGDTISLTANPNTDDTGNAAAVTDGADGSTMEFKINGVTKMTADDGEAGLFSAAGSGAGGAGGSGSGTTSPTIYAGKAGKAGSGSRGGRSGYRFGNRRYPAAHFNGFSVGSYDGNGPAHGDPGSGSCAAPGTLVLAVGGAGKAGIAIIAIGP